MKYKKLGIFLRQLRNNAGLSQGDISKAMGWKSPQLVSNNERGVSHPPFGSVKALAKLYSVDYVWLKGYFIDYLIEAYAADLEEKI